MNSEELELSLRSEFETYLKNVQAELRQEAEQFQTRIEAEFESQKMNFNEAFRALSARFDSVSTSNDAFGASVSEHLRLARDEGARITADAMAEAEKLREESAPASEPVRYDDIRDAAADISGKDSQSAILKALVQNAGKFAPRGAFFILKNEHFVGWKVFDANGETASSDVRDVYLPVSADSILGAAARSLTTAQASREADSAFLDRLGFGRSDQAYAIPLVARGRTVAVLYADQGDQEGQVNIEALETIVLVAGLTVEVLASSPAGSDEAGAAFEDREQQAVAGYAEPAPPPAAEANYAFASEPADQRVTESHSRDFSFGETSPYESAAPAQPEPVPSYPAEAIESYPTEPAFEAPSQSIEVFEEPKPEVVQPPMTQPAFTPPAPEASRGERPADSSFTFESNQPSRPAAFEPAPFQAPAREFEPAVAVSGAGFNQVAEPVVEAPPAAPPPARLSDRPVDLPIEVPDDERRIHNDARRFARLLVSEIKLYNEKKVAEGREANDLYDRLREAIDRSREMYDKRVQPPVAAKFDYFHYELVNALAEGDAQRLGTTYPGSSV